MTSTKLSLIQIGLSEVNTILRKSFTEFSFWLNANQIEWNVAKTVVLLFKTKPKPGNTEMKLKLWKSKLNYVRYLGEKIDNKSLHHKINVHYLTFKLNRANVALYKLRHFVNYCWKNILILAFVQASAGWFFTNFSCSYFVYSEFFTGTFLTKNQASTCFCLLFLLSLQIWRSNLLCGVKTAKIWQL